MGVISKTLLSSNPASHMSYMSKTKIEREPEINRCFEIYIKLYRRWFATWIHKAISFKIFLRLTAIRDTLHVSWSKMVLYVVHKIRITLSYIVHRYRGGYPICRFSTIPEAGSNEQKLSYIARTDGYPEVRWIWCLSSLCACQIFSDNNPCSAALHGGKQEKYSVLVS